MRIMGLDVGDKTIGVAVSDPMGWTAQGIEVIRRTSLDKDLTRLGEIIETYQVEKIVVGFPRNMDGSVGPQAMKVEGFIENLSTLIELPIIRWDERLSTMGAERSLLEADLSRAKRKKVIDKMAAVFILQGYLDSL